MARVRVIVSLLNKRTQPVDDMADTKNVMGDVRMGFEFESVETETHRSGTWYKDSDGYYYWGGGLKEINGMDSSAKIPFDPNKMSWGHKWYDIPFVWDNLQTKGKGITVAVIDTGVDRTHPDLIGNIHPLSKSFIGDITDNDGHGTNMAGIIGAGGNSLVYGIAPEVKLLIVKAAENVRGADPKLFASALNYVTGIPEVDIVSISNGFFVDDPDLKTAIQNCISAKKIIVAAIGNGRDIIGKPDGPDDDTFPACYDNIIAIGAFDQQGQICNFSNWNGHLAFLAPGDYSVLTTGINHTAMMGAGTSIATAFTAGSLALLLSYAKDQNLLPLDCLQAVLNTCDDIGNAIGKDIQSGNGRMNLRNAVAKLKKP